MGAPPRHRTRTGFLLPLAAAGVLAVASTAVAQVTEVDGGVPPSLADAGAAEPDGGSVADGGLGGPTTESDPVPQPPTSSDGPAPAETGEGVPAPPASGSQTEWAPGAGLAPEPELRQPMAFAQRPMTLPAGIVRIDTTLSLASQERPGLERQAFVSFLGLVAYGTTDDLEVGAIVLPVQLAPDGAFGDPGAYGLLRLLDGPVELGLMLELRVPASGESAFGTLGSLLATWHAGDSIRLDSGVTFGAALHNPAWFELRFPVTLTIQTSDTFFLGVQSGMELSGVDIDGDGGREWDAFIPAGVFLGGTLTGSQGPSADLRLGFLLPNATHPGTLWVITFGGVFFLDP